jgi:hypothetical protein
VKSNHKSILLLLGLLILATATALAALPLRNQKTESGLQKSGDDAQTAKKWKTLIPVDEATENVDAHERSLRQAKNRRYDSTRSDRVLTEQPPDVIYGRIDESPRPPAIPVSQSDAVILGTIVRVQPYLSDDKKSIYTEFSVRVEEALKVAPVINITTGALIVVEQEGGALRLKDGHILRYLVGGTSKLPLLNRRYVLFLTLADNRRDLSILSGYELRDGTVLSLEEGGEASPYAKWDEGSFLGILRVAFKPEVVAPEGNGRN